VNFIIDDQHQRDDVDVAISGRVGTPGSRTRILFGEDGSVISDICFCYLLFTMSISFRFFQFCCAIFTFLLHFTICLFSVV